MTLTYNESGSDALRKVRALVYMLCFDDLLAVGGGSYPLDDALPFRVGRAAEGEGAPRLVAPLHLTIADRWASTSHCHVKRVGTADVVHDDGSRNGTWVNGERVDRYRALADGDVVEVGHTLLCYRVVDEHAARALAGDAAAAAGPTGTRSAEMAAVIRDLRLIARSREPVLLTGDAGVGKETAARAVHEWSGRRGPLRVVDCGAVADAVALAREPGDADGGTVLLDGVERLNDAAQAALLRAGEEGRVGPDARFVATTTANLYEAGAGFRADLLRSLAGYVAALPPLRRRREDLGTLGAYLLSTGGFARASITPAAGRALYLSAFPGNIRQLRTVLRAAATLAGDGPIDLRHLPPLDAAPAAPGSSARGDRASGAGPAGAPTAQQIVEALEATGGNVVRAAECLGTHPRQVYRWIERHEIDLDRLRR